MGDIGMRYVDEGVVVERVANVVAGKQTERAFVGWLRRQPELPDLVGASAAAELLGVKAPHLSRLRKAGVMPEAIPVEGGYGVYRRADIERLARDLAAKREEKRDSRRKVAVAS